MPTLQDVARQAGVSTATVSKVLSNTPYFTEATRRKVMQVVSEVGYIPNLAARALTNGKTQIVGVVFPYIYEMIFEDALVMSVLKGIESVCWERNYNILVSSPRIDKAIDRQFQMLVQSGYFDGMICLDSIDQTSFAEFARANGVPNIVVGYHESPYFVRCDDLVGSRELMNYVLAQGHRDIGIITITGNKHLGINKRKEGLFDACVQAGIDTTTIPIAYGDYSIQSGRDAVKKLIDNHPALTAIISMNDRMAIGAVQYLQCAGKRVPDDVSVVGFDNIEMSQLITPSLTTVDQRPVEQGRIAAQMLFDVLDGKFPESVILDTKLIIRESTASTTDT